MNGVLDIGKLIPWRGHDPYSASKAATEIVINSWRSSFGFELNNIFIATARSGNVIGGGDWSPNRIVTTQFVLFQIINR